MSAKPNAKGKGCWYFVSVTACVICGRTETLRERQWTPRPKNPRERFEYIETGCGGHFL